MKYTKIFFDTETTGLKPHDRLLQLAYKKNGESYDEMFNELFLPPVEISIDAMVVHHITPQLVADKPAFMKSAHFEKVKADFENENTILIAHNAPFDVAMIKKENIEPNLVIDTVKIAYRLDKEGKLPSKSLQYLRYLLGLDDDVNVPITAHDAKGDVIILELLFERLYKKMKIDSKTEEQVLEEMIQISKEPILLANINFGKHNGRTIADVLETDRNYLEWLLEQKEASGKPDEVDWIYTLKYYLNKIQ